ncbi:hypothetical protein [Pseudofrankia asymbiotica]|uniref:Uncharacterized protein n=1 Tax=Pseudofrankia asymbiotica TaxID=1834516 RepID=A0A1V2I3S3_9ACTN|nr:hypothetical protein [Pseudofrankia asymbiotica]ONH25204.1 hypothetical protein BL253_27940 [Pseudofrankia asymbiotica]
MSTEPLVSVRRPRPDTIHLTVRPAADGAAIGTALADLPDGAFYVDHHGDPTHVTLIFRVPPDPQPGVVVPPAGWTPATNGHRPAVNAAEQAVDTVTAGLLLGAYDRDILHPPLDRTRATVLTIVRLVRVRADALSRPAPRTP